MMYVTEFKQKDIYWLHEFREVLEHHGIECNMSARGHFFDNAPPESFFALFRHERVERRTYDTREEANADIFDYIERLYSRKRSHGYLSYLRPVEYENGTMGA